MNRKIGYLLGFLIIGGALVYLMTTSFKSSLQYYVTVKEALAAKAEMSDKIIKIAGIANNIVRTEENDRSVYKFDVVENTDKISVAYTGFIPDTFKEGANVVVTGSLEKDGTFKATNILAKCASKYEAKIVGNAEGQGSY